MHDVLKFNQQYSGLNVYETTKFHDRFIIIDRKHLYHIGASLKDLGNKTFVISKIDDEDYIHQIIERL